MCHQWVIPQKDVFWYPIYYCHFYISNAFFSGWPSFCIAKLGLPWKNGTCRCIIPLKIYFVLCTHPIKHIILLDWSFWSVQLAFCATATPPYICTIIDLLFFPFEFLHLCRLSAWLLPSNLSKRLLWCRQVASMVLHYFLLIV